LKAGKQLTIRVGSRCRSSTLRLDIRRNRRRWSFLPDTSMAPVRAGIGPQRVPGCLGSEWSSRQASNEFTAATSWDGGLAVAVSGRGERRRRLNLDVQRLQCTRSRRRYPTAATGELANQAERRKERTVPLILRIDTPIEVDYYRHGGILPFVLRDILQSKRSAA